jgi:hypothetical protein
MEYVREWKCAWFSFRGSSSLGRRRFADDRVDRRAMLLKRAAAVEELLPVSRNDAQLRE